jgi:hypothetical protein
MMSITQIVSEHENHAYVQQPASGWSIFWALLAIVSSAMLQPSFTGYLFHGNAFEGSLWPHRSSPFVCLVDATADVYMSIQALHSPAISHTDGEARPGRNNALTRVALFSLGVIPQAIKIFSMQGIAMTQAIAAAFFLSSTTSLIRSLIVGDPEKDVQTLLQNLNQPGGQSQSSLKVMTVILGWLPHAIGVYVLWYGLVEQMGISAPADIRNAVHWMSRIYTTLFLLCFLQHIIFGLFRRRPLVSHHALFLFRPPSSDLLSLNEAELEELRFPSDIYTPYSDDYLSYSLLLYRRFGRSTTEENRSMD